jgi:hypothetical protein
VIIDNLDLVGVPVLPNKTNTPLVVDANTVLPLPATVQRFQPVPGRRCHVSQFRGTIQLPKLPPGDLLDRLKPSARLTMVKPPGFRAAERPDHNQIVLRAAYNVKR